MKRDLKINYGILDDIINQLNIYKRSLSNMESSLSTITSYIEQNHGESIEAWKERMKGSKQQMVEYENQIEDLLNLFQGYVDDTTAYITPLQRNAMMRVDRNDIYWNLKQMESGIDNNVPKAISRTYKSPSFWGFWEDVTDAEKNASSINKSRIANIRSDIQQANNSLNRKMDQLWDIYNLKVKKFENVDDDYNSKAAVLKGKYTNFFEGFWDSLEADGKFIWDLVSGIFNGLVDIVVGLVTIVVDAGIISVSNQIPDIIEPKFLKDASDERIDNYTAMVQQIVEDPFSVVEGIAQSFSDSAEEEGIVYVTGNFAAGFVPVVGWSKYARIGKVFDTDKPKKPVRKPSNEGGDKVDPVEVLANRKKISDFGKYSTNIDDKVKVIEKENLPDWISESFTDSNYRTVITEESIILYRAYGGGAKANGSFVTTSPAGNRINAKENTALVPDWKNTREYEAVIEVPKGQILNIGRVEKQYTKSGALLKGDGDQILLPQGWPSEWIKEIRNVPSR
jgi:hypothetical protein